MKETKYLGMVMDENLTFKNHMDTVKLKLHRANGLLAKLRHYVNPVLLRTILLSLTKKLKNPKQSFKKYKFQKPMGTKSTNIE